MLAKFMSPDYAQHVADRRLLRDKYKKLLKAAQSKESQDDIKAMLADELARMDAAYDEKHK